MFASQLALNPAFGDHRRDPGLVPLYQDQDFRAGVAPSGGSRLHPSLDLCVNRHVEGKAYRFGCARTRSDLVSATTLIAKRYAWRGYEVNGVLSKMQPTNEVTLIASCGTQVKGTLTVRVDGQAPLLSEALYPDEIALLRSDGARLCEFGRLAFEEELNTLEILGPLFHLAILYAYTLNGCTDAVVEVNPRHRGFYQRLFGFEVLGEERTCERVSAPAVLLTLPLSDAAVRACEEGGERVGHRSIYPYCLGPDELGAFNGARRTRSHGGRQHVSAGLHLVY